MGFAHGEQAENSLIGKWKHNGYDEGFKYESAEAEAAAKREIFWVFDKSKIVAKANDRKKELNKMAYVIDTSKTPHWITMNVSDGHKEVKHLGIFRVVADELHIQWEIEGGGRPAKFTDGMETTFTRVLKK